MNYLQTFLNFPANESKEIHEIRNSLHLIDDHLNGKIQALRKSVLKTRDAVLKERQRNNRQNTLVPIGIMLGVWLQQVASNFDVTTVTPALIFARAGSSIAAASFAGSRALKIKSTELNCGLNDLNKVLNDYAFLLNLEQTYAPYANSYGIHQMPPELWPNALKYHQVYFGIDLQKSLSCLLGDGSQSSGLFRAIGAVQSDLNKRVSLSKKLLEAIKEDQEKNQGYSQANEIAAPSYNSPSPSYNSPSSDPYEQRQDNSSDNYYQYWIPVIPNNHRNLVKREINRNFTLSRTNLSFDTICKILPNVVSFSKF